MSREHGTAACCVWGPESGCLPGRGCRCEPCRAASREQNRKRRRRAEPAYVGATEAREHVRDLMAHGVGMKTIARKSGVPHGSLWKLIYGKDGRPSKRVAVATRDALLAVKRTDHADGALVDAGPTWEAIGTLLGRGWTKAGIARELGQTTGGLQLSRSMVTAGNARTVAALLDAPVPPRRTRFGPVEVEQPVVDEQAEFLVRAAAYDDRYELPSLAGIVGPWKEQAACRGDDVPSWLFFPGRGDNETVGRAKAVCGRCPVADECREAGVGEVGVWGGTSAKDRRRKDPAPLQISHGTIGGYRTHLRRGETPCPACAEDARQYQARRKADRRVAS